MIGSLARARAALAAREFRFVLTGRLVSQLSDGVFQAYLVDRIVFLSADSQGTALAVTKALAVLVIPYSIAGPFAGVFVDRWSRRRVLVLTPLVRAVVAIPLLWEGSSAGAALYALALVVVSLDRFYLTTAGAVMPSVVPAPDLLVGNAMAGALGTVATFLGFLLGSQLADGVGAAGLALAAAVLWAASGAIAVGIRSDLRGNPAAPLLAEVRRVAADLVGGARRLAATPPALGGVTSVTLDQVLFGVVTVLSIIVFKHRFEGGVASYGRIVGVGGAGLIIGAATVGWLESRGLTRPRTVGVAFALGGLACVAVAPSITPPGVLVVSFLLGLAYPWKKVPVDTVTQETVPDRFRGRVFAFYDLGASTARVLGALIAAAAIPRMSSEAILAWIGGCYLAWALVAVRWIGSPVRARVHFYAGGRADEVPRSVRIGSEDLPVEVVSSRIEERNGVRRRCFRVRGADGDLDLVEDPSGRWLVAPAPGPG